MLVEIDRNDVELLVGLLEELGVNRIPFHEAGLSCSFDYNHRKKRT